MRKLSAQPSSETHVSLRRNFSWTFSGNVVYAASQWGILMLLTKVTPPHQVGQYALALAVTAPIMLFANLSLRTLQATDTSGRVRFSDYLGLRLATVPSAIVVIALIAFLIADTGATLLVILSVSIAKGIEAISDVYYGRMQQVERMDMVARSMLIKGPLSLATFGAAVYWTRQLVPGVLAMCVAWAGVLWFYDARSAGLLHAKTATGDARPELSSRPRWRRAPLFRLLRTAAPLAAVALLISLIPNVPRYFVEYSMGEADLGVFAALAYLIVVGGTIVNALGQSAMPRLSRYYASNRTDDFRRLLHKLLAISVAIGSLGVLASASAGELFLRLMYTDTYAAFDGVLIWIMLGGAISYMASFLWYGVSATRRFDSQVPVFVATVVAAVISSVLLIPRYGLLGAAWAYCVSMVIQCGGMLMMLAPLFYRRTSSSVGPV